MGSARTAWLLAAALIVSCRRKIDGGAPEPARDDAATASVAGPAQGPTMCRDGRLFDHDGRGLSLRSGDPRDPHDPGIDDPASPRDARVSLYGTVGMPSGALSEVQLARETCRAYAEHDACFVDEMKATPQLAGALELAVTVDADGNVRTTTRRDGTLSSGALVACLARSFSALKFPTGGAPTSFVYSMRARTHPLLSARPIQFDAARTTVGGPGSFDAAALLAIVVANVAPIEECYERGLETDATLKGELLVTFDVDATGTVSHVVATAGSTMPDPKVNSCVLGAIGKLVFPAPKGGPVSVRLPLRLTNENAT